MKRTALAATAATLLWASALHAEPVLPNAAVTYCQATQLMGPAGENDPFGKLDWEAIEGKFRWDDMPADFKVAFEKLPQAAIKAALRAAKMEHCDFQVPREDGLYAVLPHLGQLRQLTRVIRVDARGQLAQGNVDAAAERVSALYTMARHLKSDQTLISTLVAQAIAQTAHQEVEAIVSSGAMTAAVRARLSEAVEKLGTEDPFGHRTAIDGERRWVLDWIRAEFKGPKAGLELVKKLNELGALGDSHPDYRMLIAALDEQKLNEEADRLDRYYDEVLGTWGQPDAEERLARIARRLEQGEFGVLTPLAASLKKIFEASQRADAELAKVRETLAEPAPAR